MNKCPYCGFELKEGDVFCLNCGAAIDEDFKTVYEPPKKKKHTVLWIILAAVAAVLAGTAVYALNRPEVILARAAGKTMEELKNDEGLSFITETLEHGSVEVNMELGDLISGFSLPLLDEIDARAGIKVYNNAEKSEKLISITGSLGGSSALGLDIWAGPEHIILKSPALIGRDAYGIALNERESREEAEALIKEYTGIDAEAYDEYITAVQSYQKNKGQISSKLFKKLYMEVFRIGDVSTEKTKYDFGNGDEKTKIITVSFDRDRTVSLINELYSYAEKDEDLAEFAAQIDRRWLNDLEDSLNEGFLMSLTFYIDADNRLARVETRTDGVSTDTSAIAGVPALPDGEGKEENITVVSAVQFYDGDLFAALCVGDVSAGLSYVTGRNSSKDYSARLECRLSADSAQADSRSADSEDESIGAIHQTAAGDMDFRYECDFSWKKDTGSWELFAGNDFKVTGTLRYDPDMRRAEAVVSNIHSEDFTFEPNANIIVIADDAMPEAPDFRTVSSQSDVDDFTAAVTGNVQSLISEFMADYMSGGLAGGISDVSEEPAAIPAVPDENADEQEEPDEQEEAYPAALEESAEAAWESTGAENDAAAVLDNSEAAANEVEASKNPGTAKYAAAASEDNSGTVQKDVPVSKLTVTAMGTAAETEEESAKDKSAASEDKKTGMTSKTTDQKDKTENGSKKDTGSNKDSASNKDTGSGKSSGKAGKPDRPVSGTYYYDDGKKFSFDFSTGKYTEHVTVKATLYTDGTYKLTYSNGLISYDDTGTYNRDSADNMTFASSTGINATGKYYEDYIEVTIPGYITEKLKKIS